MGSGLALPRKVEYALEALRKGPLFSKSSPAKVLIISWSPQVVKIAVERQADIVSITMATEEDCGLTQLLVDLSEARTRVDTLVELVIPLQASTSPVG